jgi:hypothetical protein
MRLVHEGETQMNARAARTLRSYQERSATFLYEQDAAFLIAPLGAGKGAAALTALAELIRDGHRRHALVIAPLVAETVWLGGGILVAPQAPTRPSSTAHPGTRARSFLAAERGHGGIDLVPCSSEGSLPLRMITAVRSPGDRRTSA